MQGWEEDFKNLVADLNIAIEGLNGTEPQNKDEEKKLKKKLKKFVVEKNDNNESAVDKTKKLLDEIYKNYQTTAKQFAKTQNLKTIVATSKTERDSAVNQVKMVEGLQKQFKKKYEDLIKQAQQVEKQEEDKRKALIEELQKRIKTVQEEYEAAGKIKIEKYRQNQTLKHELSKIEPQAVTTQSLMDAQLKKKEIEIEIHMTTLKQKIEMMSNFKKMSEETKEKLEKAEETNVKIEKRLGILEQKQNENKIVVTRAHLVLEQYKQSITKINELLGKHERDAIKAQQALRKKQDSMQDIDRALANADKEYETNKNQIQILLNLQEALKKELLALPQ